MALPPKFSGQTLPVPSTGHRQEHTLELYLDYVCPFSAKLFKTFYASARPLIQEKYQPRLRVIFRQHIQPWHPSSTLTHEAGAAVLKLAPHKFWDFSAALFERQREFFDVNVVNQTRNETYKNLASIGESVGVDKHEMLNLLAVSNIPDAEGQLNTGNKVTNDIKLMVKAGRVVGVHVSPTVYFNVRNLNHGALAFKQQLT
jgi:protein-disulfide isomerase